MPCEVEYTDEFEDWWNTLDEAEQGSVDAYVRMLEEFAVALGFPYSSDIKNSRHTQMRELRVQHKGRPYRVLYATRDGWLSCSSAAIKPATIALYEEFVPVADALYAEHLETLEKEIPKNG